MKDSRRNRKKVSLTRDDWFIVCIAMLFAGPPGAIIAWMILHAMRDTKGN